MKYRMAFVAAGAAIGLFYVAAGVLALRWAGVGSFFMQVWAGLTAAGAGINVFAAVTWSDDEDSDFPGGRLLLMQSYLPLALVAAAVIFFCAPFVFLIAWLTNGLCIVPVQMARALLVRRRVRARMREAGRWLSWDALEPLLAQGKGVLILDATACRPGLVWWSDDELLADAGLLVMPDDRFRGVSHEQLDRGVELLFSRSHFQGRYLDEETGCAWLTPLGGSFVESRKFLREYPGVVVFVLDSQQGRISQWRHPPRRAA